MISLVVTYYNQPAMLARQLHEWAAYPPHVRQHFRFVIVDDGSQVHPASDVLLFNAMSVPVLPTLYRIDEDIPWNQHGARNLAAREAQTYWLLMLDIDHVLTAENAARLVARGGRDSEWFKFPRERIGAEDETRTKDSSHRHIDPTLSRVPVNPAMNCYLTTRDAYWKAGGYNEDFSGCYGGDTQFLRELRAIAGEPVLLGNVWLQVHTRHSVSDANTQGLDRSPDEFRRRLGTRAGATRGHNPVRFKWRKVL